MAGPRRNGNPPSIKDVAGLAGVSVGTVSNALNYPEKVSPDLVARVNTAIESLGYVRNEAARQLRVGHSDTIGLIVSNFEDPFYRELARGVDDAAAARGLSVLSGSSHDDPDRHNSLMSLFEKYRVDGIVMAPDSVASMPLGHPHSGAPRVLVGHKGKSLGLSSVHVDQRGAGAIAARHLLKQGATRVVIVTGAPRSREAYSARESGALTTLRQAGVSVEVIAASELSVAAGRRIGREILQRRLGDRPDGVFATHDLWAIGVVHALSEVVRGLETTSVVGCEDIDIHQLCPTPLTSVHLPAYEMGAKALELLVASTAAASEHSNHASIPATLVVRASSTGRLLPQTV